MECIKRDLMMAKEEVLDHAILECLDKERKYNVKELKELLIKYSIPMLTDNELDAAFKRLNIVVTNGMISREQH